MLRRSNPPTPSPRTPPQPAEVAVPHTAAALGPSLEAAASSCWPYPFPLPLGDQMLACDSCGAERDWLLIHYREHIFVRCRCAHQWVEPRIPVDWYQQHLGEVDAVHPTPDAANSSLGFDGTFAGTYW